MIDRADLALRFADALTEQSDLSVDVPTSVAIWTTTPWTLPANRAVAVHPQFDYALVEFDLERGPRTAACWPSELVKSIMHTLGIDRVDGARRRSRARLSSICGCSIRSTIARCR